MSNSKSNAADPGRPLATRLRRPQLSSRLLAKPIITRSLCLAGVVATGVALFPPVSWADILDQYTFGTTVPGVLTPTQFDPNLAASDISADSGLALDLTSPATAPPSSPYLRTTFNVISTTAAAAVANNADFKFTLTANVGFQLNLTTLTFDVMRGGAGTPRGFEVRSSADNFATALLSQDVPTVRPTLTPITIDLTGSAFQGLSAITFKIFSYSPATGSSVDYDTFVVNGKAASLGFNGYTWKGSVNGNWDTTTANWTGPGTTYVDNTATSNVLFDDTGTTIGIIVGPNPLNPNSVTFNNTSAKNYTFDGNSLTFATTFQKGGNGTVTFNNTVSAVTGEINAGAVVISNTGSLTFTNLTVNPSGTLTVATNGILGSTTNLIANGAVILNGANQMLAGLSGSGTGVITLNSTTLEVTGAGSFAGRLTGAGSLLKSGSGILTLSGSVANNYAGTTTVTGGTLNLGKASGVNAVPGNITVTGGGALTLGAANQILDTADVTIGDDILGGFMRTNSNAETFHNLTITVPLGSTYNLGNFTTSVLSNLTLTGTLSITNGEHDIVNSNTFVTANTLVLNGSIARLGANSNPSIVNVGSGGLTMTNATFTLGTAGAAFPAQVNLSGNLTGSGTNAFNISNTLGPRAVDLMGGNRTFNITDGITTIGGTVQNGSLIKTGDGTLALAGTNTYVGPTTVNAGILQVNGTLSGTLTTINAGTLSGVGTVAGVVLAGGTLAPGAIFGTLNTGDVTMNSGNVAIEIISNFIGAFDQLNVTGAVTLNAPINLTLDFSNYDPVDGTDSFIILSNDLADPIVFASPGARFTYSGATLNEGSFFTATSGAFTQIFQITYAGGDGNDVVLTAVPEPGAAALLIGGGAGLLGTRRSPRRRSAS